MLRARWLVMAGSVMVATGVPGSRTVLADGRVDGAKLRATIGPYPSREAMCPKLGAIEKRFDFAMRDDDPPNPSDCPDCIFNCEANVLQRVNEQLPAPMSEVVLFLSSSAAGSNGYNHSSESYARQKFLNAAMRVGSDWYLAADLDSGLDGNQKAIELLEVAVRPVGAHGEQLLVVRYAADQSPSNMFEAKHESVTVLGIGRSKKPAALFPVVVRSTEGTYPYGEGAVSEVTNRERDFAFMHGAIVVRRETRTLVRDDVQTKRTARRLDERHPLELP